MTGALDYAKIADLYDAHVQFADDLPYFTRECSEAGGPVLELMCGTGRVSLPLAKAGVDLTCVDASPEMLSVLRLKLARRELSVRIVEQDVCRLDLPDRYALAILPFHAFAELVEEADRRACMASVREHLADGGRFLVTLHNPKIRLRTVDGAVRELGRFAHPSGDGDLVVKTRLAREPGTRIVSGEQIYEEEDDDGRPLRRRSVPIRFALLAHQEFETLAIDAGFTVQAVHGDYRYGEFDPDESRTMVWDLRRS